MCSIELEASEGIRKHTQCYKAYPDVRELIQKGDVCVTKALCLMYNLQHARLLKEKINSLGNLEL